MDFDILPAMNGGDSCGGSPLVLRESLRRVPPTAPSRHSAGFAGVCPASDLRVQAEFMGKQLTIRRSRTVLNKKDLGGQGTRRGRRRCPVLGRGVRIRTAAGTGNCVAATSHHGK